MVLATDRDGLLLDRADLALVTAYSVVELVGGTPQLDGHVVVEVPAGTKGGCGRAIHVQARAGQGIGMRFDDGAAADDGDALAGGGVGGILRKCSRREDDGGKQGDAQGAK